MSDEIENISSFNDNELNTAYIPKGMKIVGNVNSDGNLSLAGEVEGNVSIAGNLELNGKVKGDSISVGRTELTEGTIWSNIECADYIKIGKGVSVVGNITADKADIEGAVLGDIDVKNKVYIGKEAVVKGDLVAGEVSVELGAVCDINLEKSYKSEKAVDFFDKYMKEHGID